MVCNVTSPDRTRSELETIAKDLALFVSASVITSLAMFYTIGGFLHFYFYYLRRDVPDTWKCQPTRFLTSDNHRHEILVGTFNMTMSAVTSGILARHVYIGGYTTLYFNVTDKGFLYLVLSTIGTFFYIEAATYYAHRFLHTPLMYKRIHKHHHRYHSPTAFATVAMHPVELLLFQVLLMVPMFVIPLHAAAYVLLLLYGYYFGMIDHSGIMMPSWFPWQPPTLFHDDHHK
jgi:lathosterol oxidase